MSEKIVVELNRKTIAAIDDLASRFNCTREEVINMAIAHDCYFWSNISAGGKILVMSKNKEIREVLFR